MIVSILFIGIVTVYMLSSCQMIRSAVVSIPFTSPTLTPEPIIPTRTPIPTSVATITATVTNSVTPVPGPTGTPAATLDQSESLETDPISQELIGNSKMERFGITGSVRNASSALEAGLPFGAVLNWNVKVNPPEDEFVFWQMVRTEEAGIRRTTWEEIELAIQANPSSYWMVGNEPDVRWQDSVTPQRYAEIYHEVYSFIKERDPEAKLVIGGVS
jgi:hypothetical protein